MAVPAGPPLKTLPLQQDIWIGGTIQQGNGQYAPGDYMTLLLDHPAASPCNVKNGIVYTIHDMCIHWRWSCMSRNGVIALPCACPRA